jgi:hypothetical protein
MESASRPFDIINRILYFGRSDHDQSEESMGASHKKSRELSQKQAEAILGVLRTRFEENTGRHPGLSWASVEVRLLNHPDQLWSLNEMERTGGEPDVIGRDKASGEFLFVDCAPESPSGRRSLCYDQEALNARKEHKPKGSAVAMARAMGIEILSESHYRQLQELGAFDTKTSSWIQTPAAIRSLGGALFCDRRYDAVFLYHNGAESYYAARGFRGLLRV